MQVGEIDAAERLVLAGDRLRIVHGGGDELFEVDVLDVEGLAHMRAARAQQLRDLLLILRAVELGLHRIRRGRDLTERQRGREDLDEERFHRTLRRLDVKTRAAAPSNSAIQNGFLAVSGSFCRAKFRRFAAA